MADLKGTKTEKNLLSSFIGESQARNKYSYFAEQARKEGYIQIALAFEETANHEKEHAKRFLKFLDSASDDIELAGIFHKPKLKETLENLQMAAEGENYEYTEMYPAFAKTAREEGFEGIAKLYEFICIAEEYHETRFKKFADNIIQKAVFQKTEKVIWRCSNCGFIHTETEAPKACPACAHPQSYFEMLAHNY